MINSHSKNRMHSEYRLSVFVFLFLFSSTSSLAAGQDIQFNTDVLDVKDRSNIDLTKFSRAGYIMPGTYPMKIRINETELTVEQITFLEAENDPDSSVPCLTPDIMKVLGLKEKNLDAVTWWHDGKCAVLNSVPGMTATGNLGQSSLFISIPQAYMEYSSDTWDPPSRWDNGIPGVLFDYNIDVDKTSQQNGGDSHSVNGTGVAGANLGPWRFRADWQYQQSDDSTQAALDWTRYYLYRALPGIESTLTLGQDTMSSQLFDNFQFLGANLSSDDKMIPPNMRGYAPEINGIANTNAKVTVSQQGRVLYQTQVPAGPFSIQELSDSVSGKLDVKVEEQNGDVHTWQVDTASIPYLSRPGSKRYSLSVGRPVDWDQHSQGPLFGSGELSWGISNGWSIYGGILASDDYQAISAGFGRDLLVFGAISFDVTQSIERLPGESRQQGRSLRVSYSKRFDDYDSQITFAGYRFSQKSFMSMSEYIDALNNNDDNDYNVGSDKEMYTVTANKQFRDLGISLNLTYSHQTYWDHPQSNNWNLSISRYFDIGKWKNISVNLNGYRNQNDNNDDKGAYISISVPFGDNNTLTYSGSAGSTPSQNLGWYDRIGRNDSLQINAGTGNEGKGLISGYYTHDGDIAQTSLTGSYQEGEYNSLGLSATGGITITPQGAALHRVNVPGGTRLMVDTGGVSGVPVSGNGSPIKSNIFGKAVIADVNSYYRNTAQINVNDLGDNVEAVTSVVQDTLTDGAIGYRKFEVIAGRKLMAVIKKADGNSPPFGSTVLKDGHQTGIVGDDGAVWLSGVEANGRMEVIWDDGKQCLITFPEQLPAESSTATLLLPCR